MKTVSDSLYAVYIVRRDGTAVLIHAYINRKDAEELKADTEATAELHGSNITVKLVTYRCESYD